LYGSVPFDHVLIVHNLDWSRCNWSRCDCPHCDCPRVAP